MGNKPNPKNKKELKAYFNEALMQVCYECKEFSGVTLFNVILKNGKKAKACQNHVGLFRRVIK